MAIFDDAGDDLHIRLGSTPEHHRAHGTGTFDLEHHTNFLKEVMPGDRVAVYSRMVDYSAKRMHYLMFLINETRQELAAIFECVNGLVDQAVRKMVPYPPEITAKIQAAADANAALDWAPVCGAMRA